VGAIVGVEDFEGEVIRSVVHHTVAEEASRRAGGPRDWRKPNSGARHAEESSDEEENGRFFSQLMADHGRLPRRLTAYEFSGNTRANARVLSAATRG
jgi:hypothetical protein